MGYRFGWKPGPKPAGLLHTPLPSRPSSQFHPAGSSGPAADVSRCLRPRRSGLPALVPAHGCSVAVTSIGLSRDQWTQYRRSPPAALIGGGDLLVEN